MEVFEPLERCPDMRHSGLSEKLRRLRADGGRLAEQGATVRRSDPQHDGRVACMDNPVKVMAEAGVDISGHRSKNVAELVDVPFDYVVTVCGRANETCPVFPGRAKIDHVGFDDPPALAQNAKNEQEALDVYRRVRDEIRASVATVPDALTGKQKE